MATSKMVNFRATDAEVQMLKTAAKAQGLTVSDLIKQLIRQGLGVNTSVQLPKVKSQGPVCIEGNPGVKCKSAVWVKTQAGDKLCRTCGVTRT